MIINIAIFLIFSAFVTTSQASDESKNMCAYIKSNSVPFSVYEKSKNCFFTVNRQSIEQDVRAFSESKAAIDKTYSIRILYNLRELSTLTETQLKDFARDGGLTILASKEL